LRSNDSNDCPASSTAPPRRVLILSADVGEGHAAAARALREQLESCGEPVEVALIDGLAAMGPLLRSVVSDGYRRQLQVAPASYSLYYWLLKHAAPVRGLTKLMLTRMGAKPLARAISEHAPDVVVSTYPAITVVLGYMRRRRMLDVPAVATITDMTGLFFWAQRGIDAHLVMYEASVRDVERIAGPGSAQVVRPLIAAEFLEPREPAAARAALGLPRRGHVVVVSGGGWGVGDLAGAVDELARIPDTTVVCVAGRNDAVRGRLAERFADSERVRILGFTDRMADLLAAADVLVHSTGGVTCLEAMARGCPVVSYGLPVGHAKLNTRRMAEHELLALASSPAELVGHVERSRLDGAKHRQIDVGARPPGAADMVLRAPLRVRPISRWRLRAVRTLTSTVLALGLGVWVMSTDELDALAAVLSHQVKIVPTKVDAVDIIVRTPPSEVRAVALRLKRDGIEASFASTAVPSAATLRVLHQLGDDAVPAIDRGSMLGWIHTAAELRRDARRLHLGRHFYYLEPSDPSFGELVLAHVTGAQGVTGAVQFRREGAAFSRKPGAGDIVVVRLPASAGASRAVSRLVVALRESRLSGVPLPTTPS
jgi:UDP-N-acetylglucosamine:LPS N-acetylglucosamine transferase